MWVRRLSAVYGSSITEIHFWKQQQFLQYHIMNQGNMDDRFAILASYRARIDSFL